MPPSFAQKINYNTIKQVSHKFSSNMMENMNFKTKHKSTQYTVCDVLLANTLFTIHIPYKANVGSCVSLHFVTHRQATLSMQM